MLIISENEVPTKSCNTNGKAFENTFFSGAFSCWLDEKRGKTRMNESVFRTAQAY